MIPIAKPLIGEEEKNAVMEVLNSGVIVQGPKVKELEENFAKLCSTKFAVAVNSGTAAIHTALYAAGIKEGDEIITTPFTFVASANPIVMVGAKVIFADIKEDTFNIDPEDILKKITPKTKAIIVVNLYGQPADYSKIKSIAKEHDLVIIEDACQSVGAKINNQMSGSLGNVATFSLYATKNIVCGEGGILTTNDENIYALAKRFRHHGQDKKSRYEYLDLGYNYRLTDIHAAIAIEQLKKLNGFTEKRIRNAHLLIDGLYNVNGLIVPVIKNNTKHVFHQFTIKVNAQKRESIISHLKSKGIGCGIYYPLPLHLHPHFLKLGYQKGDFPIAERICNEVISLPVHPGLSVEEINYIIKTLREVL